MRLKDTYYKLVSHINDGKCDVFEVDLLADHPVYEGHFPGMPVSPGVCNMQMIKECSSIAARKELLIENISVCRLSAVISPIDNPREFIKIQNDFMAENKYKRNATIKDDMTVFMTFKGELIEKKD